MIRGRACKDCDLPKRVLLLERDVAANIAQVRELTGQNHRMISSLGREIARVLKEVSRLSELVKRKDKANAAHFQKSVCALVDRIPGRGRRPRGRSRR